MAIRAHSIQIDASSHCQLACPSCPTAKGDTLPALGAGHLRLNNFKTLIDDNPELTDIELSNYGEMFLNPALPEMLRYAYERKVALHADNGVNLNHASDAVLEAVVEFKLRSMTCSIDGASDATYAQYRVKGKFDRVIGHIRKLNEFKRKHRTGFPILRWQFIVFSHNQHEIEQARKMAAELGMTLVPKLSWDNDLAPIQIRTREDVYKSTGHDYMRHICLQLWNAPVLNWNGKVTGCCRNFWGDFGANAFEQGLAESVNSEKMRHARQMLMGRAREDASLPCTTCDLYQVMKRDGNWLTEQEVRPAASDILLSIVPEPVNPDVTHVDILVAPGHEVDPRLLARPPQALRFAVGSSYSLCSTVSTPGDYLIYAFPKRLDPAFRKHYPAMTPGTFAIRVDPKPIAQEFRVAIA